MANSQLKDTEESDGSGAMFDRIAERYDLLNRLLSFGLDRSWRKKLLKGLGVLETGDEVLDLATGTADVAIAIARANPEVNVMGLDPSGGMLAVGEAKIARMGLNDRVQLIQGDAQALPFEDQRFAAACIAFGIRNVPDRDRALREMCRVVRPGGHVVILELTEPQGGIMAPLARFHVHQLVPRLGALLSGAREYRYLQASIAAFPPAATFTSQVTDAGLHDVRAERLTLGVAHLWIAEVN
jgi:demethylmenaquinone methyltransferase/2-methoxy-6-polyprenyl-1,4-benzoquinol methylase